MVAEPVADKEAVPLLLTVDDLVADGEAMPLMVAEPVADKEAVPLLLTVDDPVADIEAVLLAVADGVAEERSNLRTVPSRQPISKSPSRPTASERGLGK